MWRWPGSYRVCLDQAPTMRPSSVLVSCVPGLFFLIKSLSWYLIWSLLIQSLETYLAAINMLTFGVPLLISRLWLRACHLPMVVAAMYWAKTTCASILHLWCILTIFSSTNEKSEVQRSWVTCSRIQSPSVKVGERTRTRFIGLWLLLLDYRKHACADPDLHSQWNASQFLEANLYTTTEAPTAHRHLTV